MSYRGHSKGNYGVRKRTSNYGFCKGKPIDGETTQKLEHLFATRNYASFVSRLGTAIQDPKVKLVLGKGLEDGVKADDIVKNSNVVNESKDLQPIQKEIDLAKSLSYLGAHPKNVSLILKGGTLGPDQFGGNSIVTSKGKYIVDGHHRWSQVYMLNPDAKVESIDLNVSNPVNALLASQVTIASMTGEVSARKVEKGQNIYDMPIAVIQKNMETYFTPEFYEAFYKTRPEQFKQKEDVNDYILANILRMRVEDKPATAISRATMPVFDQAGVSEAADKLKSGEINLKKPFIKEDD